MSFRREDNSIAMLYHHRIRDLLASNIPQDEVKIIRNRGFTCTVCSHRPIFGTIAILAKHRQGKKHIRELSRHIKRNEELRRRVEKEKELSKIMGLRLLESKRILSARISRFLGRGEMSDRDRDLYPFFNNRTPALPQFTGADSLRSLALSIQRYLRTLHRRKSIERREHNGKATGTEQIDLPSNRPSSEISPELSQDDVIDSSVDSNAAQN